MGIKLADGSTLAASDLLGGNGEDENGNPIIFKQNTDSEIPTYTAEVELNDGTERKRVYTFSMADMNVIVHMATKDPKAEEEAKKAAEAKQQAKAAPAAAAAPAATTKQSSLAASQQEQAAAKAKAK